MAHGVEPLLPLDIVEATFLVPIVTQKLDTTQLIVAQTRQLAKQDEDLQQIHEYILHSCFTSIAHFEQQVTHALHNYNFSPGLLILVLNKKIEALSNTKCRPGLYPSSTPATHHSLTIQIIYPPSMLLTYNSCSQTTIQSGHSPSTCYSHPPLVTICHFNHFSITN